MSEKQGAIEALTSKFLKEGEEYALLKEHFDKVDADAATSEEEDNIIKWVAEMEAVAMRIIDGAAARIQRRVRGIGGRADVAKLMKKKKGKGKKGKKK